MNPPSRVRTKLSRLTPAQVALLYAGFAALWIVASGYLLTFSVNDPVLQGRIEIAKGLLFVGVTGGLLYLLLKGWREPVEFAAAAQTGDIPAPPQTAWLMPLFLVLALVTPLVGLLIVKLDSPRVEREAYANLEAIARLKAEQIESWLSERQGDSMALAADADFAARIDRFVHSRHAADLSRPILSRFDNLRMSYGYDSVLLLDSSGKILLIRGSEDDDTPALQQLMHRALASNQVQRGNLYRDESGHIHLDWVVPISSTQGKHPAAAVVMRVTAQHFLFPLIRSWPTVSPSAETLLVRREKESVLFLNELRHINGEPLTVKRPLADPELPAAIAVRTAKSGTSAGKDYRSAAVLAAYRPVVGTDWFLVAKTDRDEVLVPVRELAFWISLVAFSAIVALSVALLLLWRQQQRAQSLALLAQTSKADRLLRQFFDLPFIGMAISSPTTKRWLQFNEHLCTILGYAREELLAMTWIETTHPDDRAESLCNFDRVLRGEIDAYSMDRRYIRKDGAVVFAVVDVKCVRKPDGTADHFVTMVHDITMRKQAEEAIQESNIRYSSLFENMLNGFAYCRLQYDDQGRPVDFVYLAVNKAFEHITGLTDVVGKSVSEVVPGIREISPELFDIYGRVDTSGVPERFEFNFKSHAQWLTIAVYRPKKGEFVAVFDDITERKLAERELRIAATAFETQESIVVTDARNVILRVNQAFTRLTGYSAEEAIGRTPALLKSDRQDEQFYRDMWDSIVRNKSWHGEIWNRYKNGEAHPGWLNITAVTNIEGQITNYIATYYDITQYKEADEKVRLLAFYDPLTQLPNRRLLLERLQHCLAAGARHPNYGALLFIDLDNFKAINDTKGHNIGDLLLIEVANRLQACVRKEDTVARLGGDEFVIMLEELSEDIQKAATQAEEISGQILAAIGRPYSLQEHEHHSSASIGISLFQGNEVPVEELLKRADTAMYEAKNAGRNTLRFYDPAMQAALEARTALENDLRRALERDEFILHYQPQVDIASGKITGAEALLRWRHPERGLVSPEQFIPLAEDTGLIVPIGEWILQTACTQARKWADMGYESLRIAVNLSARQFWHKEFITALARILADTRLPVHMLELEITESLMMHDIAAVIAILRDIKAMGIRFSIDDFGTGYSSLSYLKNLPIAMVKIDQTFMRDVTSNPDDAAIVKAIITMAHSLRLGVIAEGVETQGQLAFLQQHRCDEIQGYLFSKPVAVEEFTRQLQDDLRLELSAHVESQQPTLLLVDDEDNVRSSLVRLLRGSGYRILTADSGEQGLELLALNEVGVILTDQRMPNMTGVEFLRRVKRLYPQTVRMVLSGYTELNSVTDAINEGSVYKFLTKPWEDDQLRANIEEAFSRFEMKRENARLQDEISRINDELSCKNDELERLVQDKAEEIFHSLNMLQISQEILENLSNAIIGVDELGMITISNRCADELFEAAQRGTLLGHHAADRLPAAMSDCLKNGKRNAAIVLPDGRHGEVRLHHMGDHSPSKGVVMEISVGNAASHAS